MVVASPRRVGGCPDPGARSDHSAGSRAKPSAAAARRRVASRPLPSRSCSPPPAHTHGGAQLHRVISPQSVDGAQMSGPVHHLGRHQNGDEPGVVAVSPRVVSLEVLAEQTSLVGAELTKALLAPQRSGIGGLEISETTGGAQCSKARHPISCLVAHQASRGTVSAESSKAQAWTSAHLPTGSPQQPPTPTTSAGGCCCPAIRLGPSLAFITALTTLAAKLSPTWTS